MSQGVIAWPQVRRIPMKTSKRKYRVKIGACGGLGDPIAPPPLGLDGGPAPTQSGGWGREEGGKGGGEGGVAGGGEGGAVAGGEGGGGEEGGVPEEEGVMEEGRPTGRRRRRRG